MDKRDQKQQQQQQMVSSDDEENDHQDSSDISDDEDHQKIVSENDNCTSVQGESDDEGSTFAESKGSALKTLASSIGKGNQLKKGTKKSTKKSKIVCNVSCNSLSLVHLLMTDIHSY